MTSHNAREPVEAIPDDIRKKAEVVTKTMPTAFGWRKITDEVAKAIHDAVMAEKAKSEELIAALQLADQFFGHLKNSWEVCDHTQSMMDKIKAALPASPKTEG